MEREKKGGWGGRREGAGRPVGSGTKENPRNENVTFRVSEKTLEQIRQLRELTREDEMDFNAMFIAWVSEMASDYGL
jgi:hypothetical protein